MNLGVGLWNIPFLGTLNLPVQKFRIHFSMNFPLLNLSQFQIKMIDMLLIILLDLSPLPFNFLVRFCVIKSSSRILQKMQLIIWFSSLHFTRVEINISKSCASRPFYFIVRDYGLRRPRRETKTHGDWNLLKLKTVLQSYGENYLTRLEMAFGKQLYCYVMCWN